jgi:site-specific DNA-methyltransferase (adenine-specific)
MPGGSVDAFVTDPPYSSGGAFRGDRVANDTNGKYLSTSNHAEFAGDSRDQLSWIAWSAIWLSEALRVARDGAPVVVFSDWRQVPALAVALQVAGFVWRGIVPWDKGEGCRPQPGRFRAQCEYALWGSKGPMPLDREVTPVPGRRGSSALPGSVASPGADQLAHLLAEFAIQDARSSLPADEVRALAELAARAAPSLPGCARQGVSAAEKRHATGKPVEVLDLLVRVCEPGGVVCDPFAGSCTTGEAALGLGYRFLGCEIVREIHADGAAALRRCSTALRGLGP